MNKISNLVTKEEKEFLSLPNPSTLFRGEKEGLFEKFDIKKLEVMANSREDMNSPFYKFLLENDQDIYFRSWFIEKGYNQKSTNLLFSNVGENYWVFYGGHGRYASIGPVFFNFGDLYLKAPEKNFNREKYIAAFRISGKSIFSWGCEVDINSSSRELNLNYRNVEKIIGEAEDSLGKTLNLYYKNWEIGGKNWHRK